MISSMFSRIIDAKFRVASGTAWILPAEDAFQAAAEGAEYPLHRALNPLLHVALMDGAKACRHVVALLEILHIRGASLDRPQVRDVAHLLGAHVPGRREGV